MPRGPVRLDILAAVVLTIVWAWVWWFFLGQHMGAR